MKYKYYICDVFTTERFSGNQLAVLPAAEGLSDKQMQQIAREFNFSESTFIFPAERGNTRKVRIFTPSAEIPFAGHPNIGTAFTLASIGELDAFDEVTEITFEEKAGLVPILLRKTGETFLCELQAPEPLSLGKSISIDMVANALSLSASDIAIDTHMPQVASVGLPFLITELKDRSTLARIKVNLAGFEAIAAEGVAPNIHVYVKSDDEFDIRARMFVPFDGISEDPATGSANCALAGLLTHYNAPNAGNFKWRIAQGVEMGRPSLLNARTEKKDGQEIIAFIGGSCVMVSEGTIYCD